MIRNIIFWGLLCVFYSAWGQQTFFPKTTFQSPHLWRPISDLKTNGILIYDTIDVDGKDFGYRVNTWKTHGYTPQLMISFSWGADTLHKFKWQTLQSGEYRMHGNMHYLIPEESYCHYIFQTKIKKAIDVGIQDIIFEEPEFYINCNPEIKDFNKNKILFNTLQTIITLTKEYAQQAHKSIRCYVATHSIFNYANWGIISPEILLSYISNLDGIIGQVWQDTADNPLDPRFTTFEQAYIEYASLSALTNSNHKDLVFLTDPVGDKKKTWKEYKEGYLATTIAMLMLANVNKYEVLPWPHRIFEYRYPLNKITDNPTPIPDDFRSLILIFNQMLAAMPSGNTKDECQVLISNQLMERDREGNERSELIRKYYDKLLPLINLGTNIHFIFKEDSMALSKINKEEIYAPVVFSTPSSSIDNRGYQSDYKNLNIKQKNIYQIRRGNYLLTYAIPNYSTNKTIPTVEGTYIDILDKKLKIITHKKFSPNTVSALYDFSSVSHSSPNILVSASTDSIIKCSTSSFEYIAYGPAQSLNKQRIYLPMKPKQIIIKMHNGKEIPFECEFNYKYHMLFLSFSNDHQGCHVTINS